MMQNLSLQKKLLLGLTFIIAILIIVLSSAFYSYLSSVAADNEYKTSQKITERTSSQIDELYKQMDMAALFIVKNSVIQNVLYALHDDKNITAYKAISYQAQARDQLKILSFYFPNMTNAVIFDSWNNFYFHSGLPDDDEEVNKRLNDIAWYNSLIAPDKKLKILPPHQDYWVGISRPVISVVRRLVTESKEELGMFEVDIPYWNLQNICDTNVVPNESAVLIFNENGKVIYPINLDEPGNNLYKSTNPADIFKKVTGAAESSGQLKTVPGNILFTSHKSNYTGWYVVTVNRLTFLQKQMTTYTIFVVATAIIILIFVFMAFFFLVRSLTKPLKQLITTVESVSLDNLSLSVSHEGSDELKLLDESFNSMFAKLKDSIKQIYESKIRETNAHLLALQAQMNPHFLYNTLGVISASSERFGNTDTALMCDKLSEMTRYIVSPGNSMVSLKDELTHTLNYLSLLENHYKVYESDGGSHKEINTGCHMKYEIDIPREMLSLTVPKMTLQPIVENCINHGFKNILPPWSIKIKGIMKDSRDWQISVEDNGSGFDKGILEQLNKDMQEYYFNLKEGSIRENLNIGGMGLINTFARLTIFYKDEAVFSISNNPEGGCTVTIGRMNKSTEGGI